VGCHSSQNDPELNCSNGIDGAATWVRCWARDLNAEFAMVRGHRLGQSLLGMSAWPWMNTTTGCELGIFWPGKPRMRAASEFALPTTHCQYACMGRKWAQTWNNPLVIAIIPQVRVMCGLDTGYIVSISRLLQRTRDNLAIQEYRIYASVEDMLAHVWKWCGMCHWCDVEWELTRNTWGTFWWVILALAQLECEKSRALAHV